VDLAASVAFDDEEDAAAAIAAVAAVEGVGAESSFVPVLSKSAKRRAARKLTEQYRAEAQFAAFRSPQPLGAAAVAAAAAPLSSVWRSASPPSAHMRFAPPPPHSADRQPDSGSRLQHSQSPLPALREMFPALDREVLDSIFVQCGRSFENVVEYMLGHDAAQARDDQQMQAALTASLAAAALEGVEIDASSLSSSLRAYNGTDRLSQLSADLFQLVCDHLNSFELARLASVSRDARTQVDAGAFAHVEKLDLSRFASWPDWRMLRMIARFPSTSSISFRNTHFHSFAQLAATCFGRHIRMLSFSGCPRLQDIHLHELFDLGEHLHTLDLSACENLTDDGLE
jgi:hypothetical protein